MRILTSSMAVLGLVLSMMFVSTLRAEEAKAAGVTGTWKWQQQGRNGPQDVTLKLKQEGEKVTGTITGFQGQESNLEEGTIKGKEVTFNVSREMNGQKVVTKYMLTIDGDTIKGKSEQISTREIDGKRSAE